MAKSLGDFRAALLFGWAVLATAGVLYARSKSIPFGAAVSALSAFLVTYPFYLVPAFRDLRERLTGSRLFGFVLSAAIVPYLLCCLGAVHFQWGALARLAAMALLFALWYEVFPAHPLADLTFLAFIPLVLLGKYFETIYIPIFPALKDIIVLGHIALIEVVVMVLMLVRRVKETGYGFFPNLREWRIGVLHFAYFVAVGLPLALFLKAVHFGPPAPVWKIAATFLGFLWVLSLSEEFFFRGVLQQWLEDWSGKPILALFVTSCVFGLVHIGFQGKFPNWRWVAVATILGLFCGRARNQAGSIRASMVTHALVVAAWRGFFG